jgi:hypothetical protein
LTIVDESSLSSEDQSLVLDDITVDRESRDCDSTSTSLKVDERPLTPFNKVRKIWEDRVTGMIGRIVGYETSQDATNSDVSLVKESKCSEEQCLDLSSTGTSTPFAKVKNALIRIADCYTLRCFCEYIRRSISLLVNRLYHQRDKMERDKMEGSVLAA